LNKYIQQAHICSKFKFNKNNEYFNSISNTITVQNIIFFDNIIFNDIFIKKAYRSIYYSSLVISDSNIVYIQKFRDYSGIFDCKLAIYKRIIIKCYNWSVVSTFENIKYPDKYIVKQNKKYKY